MSELSLEPVIQRHVHLSSRPSPKGWWTCICLVCNDYKRRGGFKFDGDSTTYNCFNCGHDAHHNPQQYASLSEEMQKVVDSFGIPEDDYRPIIFNALKMKNQVGKQKQVQADPDTKLIKIEMPEFFIPLEHATDTWSIVAKEYLEFDRGLNPDDYPYYILDGAKQSKEVEKNWRGRLIIPMFRNNQLVWYQGRDLRPKSKMRYRNGTTSSECILSRYDRLYDRDKGPLYVVEGFFDAECIGGVATFGNKLKAGQIKLLNQSPREKVYIPDMMGDGHLGAEEAIRQGWKVSVPDIGSCKDVNEAVMKYGKLYVMKSIKEFTLSGYHALIRVNTLCKRSQNGNEKKKDKK